jgi:hypothetical protein
MKLKHIGFFNELKHGDPKGPSLKSAVRPTPNYEMKAIANYLMPGGAATPDWMMGGQVRSGASVITREAPGLGVNAGGSLEAVVPPGGVQINWFHMP